MVICATGVYGKTEHEFFDSLLSENITLFVDIRQPSFTNYEAHALSHKSYSVFRLEKKKKKR